MSGAVQRREGGRAKIEKERATTPREGNERGWASQEGEREKERGGQEE